MSARPNEPPFNPSKNPPAAVPVAKPSPEKTDTNGTPSKLTDGQATRETVESIVVAVILAFLFRTFVAEAFVIPTGSMAPTLQGNHKDITCEKCKFQYQASASVENDDNPNRLGLVTGTTCPICRYANKLSLGLNPYHDTFTGDRILVSKFSYDLAEPERWDVIVFKYPGNGKQNYIKRLVGLPNEMIRVRHGDLLVKHADEEQYKIARKPPHKIKAMLQLVDDSRYIAEDLKRVNWPSRWQAWPDKGEARSSKDDSNGFSIDGQMAGEPSWLRYHHHVPTDATWQQIKNGDTNVSPAPENMQGQLITDFYAYNGYRAAGDGFSQNGMHWVGDIAVECDVEIKSADGQLLLDLVKGGVHYQVAIDIATGKATASILNANYTFSQSAAASNSNPTSTTSIRGPGSHRIRLSNVDHELVLWIDERVVTFDQPTTYEPDPNTQPVSNDQELGDLAPAGIGVIGATIHVSHARVLRDVYYIATRDSSTSHTDYDRAEFPHGDGEALRVMADRKLWPTTSLFSSRRSIDYNLEKDQFFPMGDNSPQSSDARMWLAPKYVERELLTGKAVLVYWPHALPRPIPYITPNVKKMRLIR